MCIIYIYSHCSPYHSNSPPQALLRAAPHLALTVRGSIGSNRESKYSFHLPPNSNNRIHVYGSIDRYILHIPYILYILYIPSVERPKNHNVLVHAHSMFSPVFVSARSLPDCTTEKYHHLFPSQIHHELFAHNRPCSSSSALRQQEFEGGGP